MYRLICLIFGYFILKLHPAKVNIARKRHRCSYDDTFLTEVIIFVHARATPQLYGRIDFDMQEWYNKPDN